MPKKKCSPAPTPHPTRTPPSVPDKPKVLPCTITITAPDFMRPGPNTSREECERGFKQWQELVRDPVGQLHSVGRGRRSKDECYFDALRDALEQAEQDKILTWERPFLSLPRFQGRPLKPYRLATLMWTSQRRLPEEERTLARSTIEEYVEKAFEVWAALQQAHREQRTELALAQSGPSRGLFPFRAAALYWSKSRRVIKKGVRPLRFSFTRLYPLTGTGKV